MSKIVTKFSEFLVSQLRGPNGNYVFTGRINQEFPDYEFVDSKVKQNEPYISLVIAGQQITPAHLFVRKANIQTISAINFTGNGIASHLISGNHIGNRKYRLQITFAGVLGVAQYRLSLDDGATWEAIETVPADGRITIGDGTIFTFGSEGELVLDDLYTWETVSMHEREYQTDKVVITLDVNIYAATSKELNGDAGFVGYMDQMLELFTVARALSDGKSTENGHIWSVNLDKTVNPYTDTREKKFRGVYRILIEGALYRTERTALIGAMTEEINS